MAYFTIIHLLVLVIYFIIFILLGLIASRFYKKKLLFFILSSNFIILLMMTVFSMLIIDKYTKKAQIEKLENKRVLRNETIVFTGHVRNIGNFDISSCSIEIKITNNTFGNQFKGEDFFKPTSGLDIILNFGKKNKNNLFVIKEFNVGKNIRAGQLKSFTVAMPYPNSFKNPTIHSKLHCR